jgi:hypothetical protein
MLQREDFSGFIEQMRSGVFLRTLVENAVFEETDKPICERLTSLVTKLIKL